jgi:hypothetical protein
MGFSLQRMLGGWVVAEANSNGASSFFFFFLIFFWGDFFLLVRTVLVPCLLLSFLRIMDTSKLGHGTVTCSIPETMYFNGLHGEKRPFSYSCPSGQSNNVLNNIVVAKCKVRDKPNEVRIK